MRVLKTVEIVSSAARTANGNSGVIAVPEDAVGVQLFINVTASGGTSPSATFTAENVLPQDGASVFALLSSAAGLANRRLSVFPGATAVANVATSDVLASLMRVSWAITGTTPSITFSIVAVFYGAPRD